MNLRSPTHLPGKKCPCPYMISPSSINKDHHFWKGCAVVLLAHNAGAFCRYFDGFQSSCLRRLHNVQVAFGHVPPPPQDVPVPQRDCRHQDQRVAAGRRLPVGPQQPRQRCAMRSPGFIGRVYVCIVQLRAGFRGRCPAWMGVGFLGLKRNPYSLEEGSVMYVPLGP